jgi:Zn-dependent protease
VLTARLGSFRLFRVAGIDVFLHWSWFVVAMFEINNRRGHYSSLAWNVAEYVALFVIVLLHEFGHALACRQVGGQADRIVLWPLGGVAFVAPPQRPGAMLWSIAAGPLVNLILLPMALVLAVAGQRMGWGEALPDGQRFLWAMVYINVGLLIFNLLPIYPLDGGQILRALLWFFCGRSRSLMVATVIGITGAAGLLMFSMFKGLIWIGVLSVFILLTGWRSLLQARRLSRIEQAPRRAGLACPACKTAPPAGDFWVCQNCRTQFDPFATGAICPRCQSQFAVTTCPQCGAARAIGEWSPSGL